MLSPKFEIRRSFLENVTLLCDLLAEVQNVFENCEVMNRCYADARLSQGF